MLEGSAYDSETSVHACHQQEACHGCTSLRTAPCFRSAGRGQDCEIINYNLSHIACCRGFRVTAIETGTALLGQTTAQAMACNVTVNALSAKAAKTQLKDATVDLVTVFHGLHLVELEPALVEVRRLLKPDRYFAAAWNDRYFAAVWCTSCHVHDSCLVRCVLLLIWWLPRAMPTRTPLSALHAGYNGYAYMDVHERTINMLWSM